MNGVQRPFRAVAKEGYSERSDPSGEPNKLATKCPPPLLTVKTKDTARVKTKMRTRDIVQCAGRLSLLLLLLPLLDLSSSLGVEAARTPPDKIHVSSLKALTFYNGDLTRARRGRPIAQMQCRGKPCGKVCVSPEALIFSASSANSLPNSQYQPDAISCQTIGSGYGGSGPEWRCQADLPASIRLGRVQVSCEGWSSPQDEYILRGSCGLEYHLLPAFDADEDGQRRIWRDSYGQKRCESNNCLRRL